MKLKKNLLLLLPIFLLSFFLYAPLLKFYFFQDDFFHFRTSEAKNIKEVLMFFSGKSDLMYYHPISIQLFYFLARKAFGLNPFPYHLFGLGLHFVNIILIYILISKLNRYKSNYFSLITAFFYGVSGIHFMVLSWVGAYHYLFGAFFSLLSFIFFINGVQKNRNIYYISSFFVFILALLSEELSLPILFLLFLYPIFFLKKKLKWSFKKWFIYLPFLITTGSYLYYRLLVITLPIHIHESYRFSFDFRVVIKSFFWQLLWSLNVPEEFKYQMISFSKLNPKFVSDFYSLNQKVWCFLLINIFFVYLFPLFLVFRQKLAKLKISFYFKSSLFGLLWFILGLLPAIFFPLHQYPYFLTIASIGFYMFFLSPLACLLEIYRGKRSIILGFLLLVCSFWVYSSFINLRFTESIHWISDRAKASKTFITALKEQFPQPAFGSTIVLPVDTKTIEGEILVNAFMNNEVSNVLYRDLGVRLLYQDFIVPDECIMISEEMKLIRPGNEEYQRLKTKNDSCLTDHKIFFLKVPKD